MRNAECGMRNWAARRGGALGDCALPIINAECGMGNGFATCGALGDCALPIINAECGMRLRGVVAHSEMMSSIVTVLFQIPFALNRR